MAVVALLLLVRGGGRTLAVAVVAHLLLVSGEGGGMLAVAALAILLQARGRREPSVLKLITSDIVCRRNSLPTLDHNPLH